MEDTVEHLPGISWPACRPLAFEQQGSDHTPLFIRESVSFCRRDLRF